MPEETQPLSSQWKKARGELVELPSGKKARLVQSLNMPLALQAGKIPNPLRSVIEGQLNPPTDGSKPPDLGDEPETMVQFGELMSSTVCAAMIDPKCEMPPTNDADGNPINAMVWYPEDPDNISYFDLSPEDRLFIYQVAQGGATDLVAFRERQTERVASVEPESEIPMPTKRASRARGAKKKL